VRTLRLLAAAALLFVAGSAFAQDDGCVDPAVVPEAVFFHYIQFVGGDFFPMDEDECEKIVKLALASCHKAVTDAANCTDHIFDGIGKAGRLACKGSKAPGPCKDEVAEDGEQVDQNIAARAALGHETCDGQFLPAMIEACLEGPPDL
jgi:hypothetical protein